MTTATQLLNNLRNKRQNSPRCLSELDSLLDQIEEYLEVESLNDNARGEDPTIATQLELSLPMEQYPPSYRPVMGGTHEKCLDTGEVRERPDYLTFDEHPDYRPPWER